MSLRLDETELCYTEIAVMSVKLRFMCLLSDGLVCIVRAYRTPFYFRVGTQWYFGVRVVFAEAWRVDAV